MSEIFTIKWDSSVSRDFSRAWQQEEFYDVTLVGDDYQEVSAHKLVLANGSEYFRNVLKRSKHLQALCIEGATSQDLNNILKFIYHGEIDIQQDQLDKFIQVGRRLKLEGLNFPEEDQEEGEVEPEESSHKDQEDQNNTEEESEENPPTIEDDFDEDEAPPTLEPETPVKSRKKGNEDGLEPETPRKKIKLEYEAEGQVENDLELELEEISQNVSVKEEVTKELSELQNIMRTDKVDCIDVGDSEEEDHENGSSMETEVHETIPTLISESVSVVDDSETEKPVKEKKVKGKRAKRSSSKKFTLADLKILDKEDSVILSTETEAYEKVATFISESVVDESDTEEQVKEKKVQEKKSKRTSSKKFTFGESTILDEEVINRKIDEHWVKVDDQQYQCGFCGKNFKNKGHVQEHIETHFDDIAFPCRFDICGELQRTRSGRRTHEKKHKMGQ